MFESISFSFLNWSWLAFVLAGLSLLFAVFYFRHQSKQLNQSISALYHLNQSVHQDALDFFDQAWLILSSVGCLQLTGTVEWFGEKKRVQFGEGRRTLKLNKRSFRVSRDDMHFEFVLYLSRDAAAQASFSCLVIQTFVNTLEQNLVLKQAEILASQKRLERYQLFVQHEIKNIAQFIQLLSEQLQEVTTDQERLRLVNRIQSTVPIMAQRANKTIQHMKQPLSAFYEGRIILLQETLREVVKMYDLKVNIEGDASVSLPRQLLQEVFKNILGNFRDHGTDQIPLTILIFDSEGSHPIRIEMISESNMAITEIQSERLFEPFWTTSESGMGLGLFLARELLKQFEAKISFEQTESDFRFLIELPGLVK